LATSNYAILLALICAFLNAVGQLFLKVGSNQILVNYQFFTFMNLSLIAGLSLYGLSAVLFIVALKGGNLSILYPLIATSYIWVTGLSVWYLNEPFTLFQWGGILLITLGVALVIQ
jgi:uncharacterized membrane protein